MVHAAARHATPPTPHRAALVPGADALPRCHGPWAGPSAPQPGSPWTPSPSPNYGMRTYSARSIHHMGPKAARIRRAGGCS